MFAFQFLAATAIVISFGALLWWLNKDEDEEKQEHSSSIDIVREAAFAVIEASLQNEPEKWRVGWESGGRKRAEYILNQEAGIYIWLLSGPGGVFVLQDRGAENRRSKKEAAIVPPEYMKARLFTAAMKVANKISESREVASLEKMVDAFWKTSGRIEHDQETA